MPKGPRPVPGSLRVSLALSGRAWAQLEEEAEPTRRRKVDIRPKPAARSESARISRNMRWPVPVRASEPPSTTAGSPGRLGVTRSTVVFPVVVVVAPITEAGASVVVVVPLPPVVVVVPLPAVVVVVPLPAVVVVVPLPAVVVVVPLPAVVV